MRIKWHALTRRLPWLFARSLARVPVFLLATVILLVASGPPQAISVASLAVLPANPAPSLSPELPIGVTVTADVDPRSAHGTIMSADGSFRVTVPKGAADERLRLELTRTPPDTSKMWRIPIAFEINAYALDRGDAEVSKFSKGVEIQWTYTDGDIAGLDPRNLRLLHSDPASGLWAPIPSTIDPVAKTVTAKPDHFSLIGGGSTPVISGPGGVLSFQTNLHTGAVAASYPIEVPRGPGQVQPGLTLRYSGVPIDEMGERDTGSWVGIGWSLGLGGITYNLSTYEYYLEIDGANYKLYQLPSTESWLTIPDSDLKITRDFTGTNRGWTVVDRQGTEYHYGGVFWYPGHSSNSDAVQYVHTYYPDCDAATAYRFSLKRVVDVHGNQLNVNYQRTLYLPPGRPPQINGYSCSEVRSAYPASVVYGGHSVGFQVSYDLLDPTDGAPIRNDNPRYDETYVSPIVMENRKLDAISVYTSGSFVRKYVFSYETDAPPVGTYEAGRHKLLSVTQIGSDGDSPLPALDVGYTNRNVGNLTWPYLNSIDNNYGGGVTYQFTTLGGLPACDYGKRTVVTQRTESSGIGPSNDASYSYTGCPQYKPYYDEEGYLERTEYRGFSPVTESDSDGNDVKHFFVTTGTVYDVNPLTGGSAAFSGDYFTGREYRTEWYDNADTLLRTEWSEWQIDCIYYCSSWFVYVDNAGTVEGSKKHWRFFGHDSYGNTTWTKDYGDTVWVAGDDTQTGDELTTWQAFAVNTTDNILDRPYRLRVYEGIKDTDDGTGTILAETRSYYDGKNLDGELGTAPTDGDLTRIQQFTSPGSTSVSTYQTFDSYGNRATETDPNGNVTTWTYDSTHHTYPVQLDHPLNLTETATWDYGFGTPLSETDVNGKTTSFGYDTFGRVVKVIRPGATSQDPSVQYHYNNWGTLNQQNLETVTRVSGTESLWGKQYFDGLGRVVQVHRQGETEGAVTYTMVEATTDFDDRGLVAKQYVPQRLDSTTLSGYEAPGAGWKYATFSFDALERLGSLTKPDGTSMAHDYSTTWQDETTNERGFKKRYSSDAFGRLVKVEELDASHAVYATTTYTNDLLGRLTGVTDDASNATSISYDALGRKTSMTDPDMGSWSYGYDANGNLTSQTDAKAQTITFEYDALNRLERRCTPDCQGTELASNTYDDTTGGNVGKGRRTRMDYDLGYTIYKYDDHGRLTQESRTFTDTAPDSVYATNFTYDDADRLATITYPDSEEVTTGYDGRGLPESLSSNVHGTLVSDADYTPLGGPSQISLGNGAETIFGYWNLGQPFDRQTDGTEQYGRLYEIRTTGPSGALQSVLHDWDATGNLVQRDDLLAGETSDVDSPSFEDPDTALVDWVEDIGGGMTATTTRVTSQDRYGGASLEIDVVDATTVNIARRTQDVAANAGEVWTVATWVNVTALSNATARLRLRWSGGSESIVTQATTTSGWVQLKVEDATAPAGTASLKIELQLRAQPGGSGTAYFDGVMAIPRNRTADPSFEDMSPALGEWAEDIGGGMTATTTRVTSQAKYGSASLEIDVVDAATVNIARRIQQLPANAGEVWTVATWVNVTALSDATARLRLRWSGGTDSVVTQATTTSGWVQLMVQDATAPAGTTSLKIELQLRIDQPGGSGTAYFDGVDAIRGSAIPSTTESFTYDFLDRLTAASGAYAESYSYNTLGNITAKNGTTYDYTGSAPHAVTQVGAKAYTYDGNGNMLTGGPRTLSWTVENRVTSVAETGNPAETYDYDGDGDRVKKDVGGSATHYVNKFYERYLPGGGVDTKHYYLGGTLVAVSESGTLRFTHQDHLGSSSYSTDASGDSLGGVTYLPFGGVRTNGGEFGTDRKFTGQRDDGTGLYFYNARYYDPELGKFVSPDSIVPDPSNPQDFNRYAYVRNGPTKYTDPTGEFLFAIPAAIYASPYIWYAAVFVAALIVSQADMDFPDEFGSWDLGYSPSLSNVPNMFGIAGEGEEATSLEGKLEKVLEGATQRKGKVGNREVWDREGDWDEANRIFEDLVGDAPVDDSMPGVRRAEVDGKTVILRDKAHSSEPGGGKVTIEIQGRDSSGKVDRHREIKFNDD